jgi:hypothetical protein
MQQILNELIDAVAVSEQLQRMLQSEVFLHSPRMSRFLSYVVECTLADDKSALKESMIGVAVFDRAASYDPKADPVVRSEAPAFAAKYTSTTQRTAKQADC